MTAKITISLPDELLAQLDAEAYALATSRSQLVQESVATYLGKAPAERDADASVSWAPSRRCGTSVRGCRCMMTGRL
jgi:metal-responsive CopG/Arc/MetJ family transcriptional regulator